MAEARKHPFAREHRADPGEHRGAKLEQQELVQAHSTVSIHICVSVSSVSRSHGSGGFTQLGRAATV